MNLHQNMRAALSELGEVADRIDAAQIDQAFQMIFDARRIMLYGCGREGLQMQGFAMRLHHLGMHVSMQGDMAASPMKAGDLFIASAGPGSLSSVSALIGQAKSGGASVLFLTAQTKAMTAKAADHTIIIPAQTMANDQSGGTSTLPMGSLYEGAMFVLFEAMILTLIRASGETPQSIRARHTNME
ncbi:SIS domain-containing protein [Octadecabacter sp.]|nr:SIS domain-containing protein [Octadecabacter sp.]